MKKRSVKMKNKELTVALVNSILRVLDHEGPSCSSCHRHRRRHRHRCNAPVHRQEPGTTRDLEWLHRTRGDPGVRSSCRALVDAANPRFRVLEMPPSPSPDPQAYRPMKLLDPTTSLRRHWEPPCAIHGWGPCPYPWGFYHRDRESEGKGSPTMKKKI
jgi:hypothetical protein